MRDIPKDNHDFAKRFVKLAEDFDYYNFIDNDCNDEDVLNKVIGEVEADLFSKKTDYMITWLNDVIQEMKSRGPADADVIGHIIVESQALLQYLEFI